MFENNLMTGIDKITQNPASIKIVQNTAASTWVISTDGHLPFEALAREVDAVVLRSDMVNGSGSPVNETPRVSVAQGANGDQIHLKWSQACKGTVRLRVRGDNPL